MNAIGEASVVAEVTPDGWREANYRYVMTEIERIRILLEHRAASGRPTEAPALAAVEAELEVQTANFMRAGRPPAIEGFAYLFGLDRFQRDLLLLCLAAEVAPSLESLFAAAQNDPVGAFRL